MKKQIAQILVFSSVIGMLYACSGNQTESSAVKTDSTATAGSSNYACPMHTSIKSDKPAACDSCGMELEKVK